MPPESLTERLLNQVRPPETQERTWTAAELYNAELPPVEGALCGHVFTAQSLSVLLGDFGLGKTWLTLSLAISIATGRYFGHMPTRKRRVIYFSEEMIAPEMQQRLRKLLSPRDAINLSDLITWRFRSGYRLEDKASCHKMASHITSANAQFAIVDTFSDVHEKEENSTTDMKSIMLNARDEIATPTGAHIALIHHTGKPNEFRQGAHRGRGSSAINAIAADILLIDKLESGARVVTFEKVRHGKAPEPFTYQISDHPDDDSKVLLELSPASETLAQEPNSDIRKLADWIDEEGPADLDQIKKHFNWADRTARRFVSGALGVGRIMNNAKRGQKAVYTTPKSRQANMLSSTQEDGAE